MYQLKCLQLSTQSSQMVQRFIEKQGVKKFTERKQNPDATVGIPYESRTYARMGPKAIVEHTDELLLKLH